MGHTTSTWRAGALLLSVTLGLTALLSGGQADAKVPQRMTIEGALRSASGGAVVDGDYFLTFSIYPGPVGGTAAWSEGPLKIDVKAGRLVHDLGTDKPLTAKLFAGMDSAWLGIKVGADAELIRQRMGSVAYALAAASAQTLQCSGCVAAAQLAAGAISADKVGFTWAASKTKGGPATSALDLQCTGCVGISELKIDGDLDLGGNALKAKTVKANDVLAATVSASGFVGDGSKLTGIQSISGKCAKAGEVVQGIAPDGKLLCVPALSSNALPKDALDDVSNDLLTNEFINDVQSAATPKGIPDNNPIGVFDEIDYPDVGLAKKLTVHLNLASSDIGQLQVQLFDPANKLHKLYAGGGKGTVLKASWPTPDKAVDASLESWVGKNPTGKWRLKVVDGKPTKGGDDGKVNDWGIAVTVVSNKKVKASGLLQTFGGLQLQSAAKHPVVCDPTTLAFLYYNTTDKSLYICNGKKFFAFAASIPPGGKDNPGASCAAIKAKAPTVNSGLYWIDPDGGDKANAIQVYCDMTTDGGGWTMVVTIDGDDELHSNINQVGTVPVQPTTPSTSKFADSVINKLMQTKNAASIRFICDGHKHFFKDCQFRATKGLASSNSCVVSYTDPGASKLQNKTACNSGSGALGCHCSCSTPASHTYCSHCDGADGAGSHNRKGCGHDGSGYSKKGSVWVR